MPAVSTVLALLALILSLLALGVALRLGRRAPVPPPPPPPPVRPPAEDPAARARLGAVEARAGALSQALEELAARVEAHEKDGGAEAAALRAGQAALETAIGQLREASERAAVASEPGPAEAPPKEPAEDRVRAHLQDEGWEEIVLLPDGEHAWRVEARRAGGLAKGRARLFPDDRVEARLTVPTRAFP